VSDDGAPLLLQVKEAQPSVLEAFAGASAYSNHGQRVIVGEHIMQAATDIFLGWTQNPVNGRYFYVRRLKDSRLANIGTRLVEAETGKHIWAERYDRDLADIFGVQDEITEVVTIAIAPAINRAERFGQTMGFRRGVGRKHTGGMHVGPSEALKPP